MPLIKSGRPVEDPWAYLDDDAPLPEHGPVIVGVARWRAERQYLRRRGPPVGVRMRSDQPPSLIADDIDRLHLIALEFPAFGDGRAYSSARLLRERHGYAHQLRAVGNVLRDQFMFMHRCGFDAFEVADQAAVDGWIEAMSEISVWYQPTADGRAPVSVLRRRRRSERPAAIPIGAT